MFLIYSRSPSGVEVLFYVFLVDLGRSGVSLYSSVNRKRVFFLATPTDNTVSSLTSSHCSTTSSLSTTDDMDEYADLENESTADCLSRFSVRSSSMSSLYSNMECLRSPSTCSAITAESVARSLLRQFNHTNSPVDSNIQWLISERDAPQEVIIARLLAKSKQRTVISWHCPLLGSDFTCRPFVVR